MLVRAMLHGKLPVLRIGFWRQSSTSLITANTGIAQFVKAVRVKRDYEIEVEFNVAFDEFQQIYLEPEKEGEKMRGTTTILALAEKVGQAV